MKLSSYIGTPFEALDCYALVRDIYLTQHNIVLPNPNIKHDDNFRIFFNFTKEISKNWVKCEAHTGAVVALRYNMKHPKIVTHFGYCVDNTKMIHTLKDTGAIMEDLSKYAHIIEGFYAYEPNCNAQ